MVSLFFTATSPKTDAQDFEEFLADRGMVSAHMIRRLEYLEEEHQRLRRRVEPDGDSNREEKD